MAATTTTGTLVGVFEDHEQARLAVAELRKSGFRDDQIGVVSHHRETGKAIAEGAAGDGDGGTNAMEGAATGLAAGAGVGALWGLAILSGLLPGIGPAIAGGTMGILLSSAAAGAAAAGVAGALIGMGIPDEDAGYYEGEFKSGRTIVTVNAGGQAGTAQTILNRYGGYNRSNRSSTL